MNDWSVLGLQKNPIPGNPARIMRLVAQLRQEAEQAENCASRLQHIAGRSANLRMEGEYAPKFRQVLINLPRESARLGPAHRACANALSLYAEHLQQAQLEARNALSLGMGADAQYKNALRQFYSLVPVIPSAGGVWRGLNQSTALYYSQQLPAHIREIAARIGNFAAEAERDRQRAAQLARRAEQSLLEAEQRCAQAILEAVSDVRAYHYAPLVRGGDLEQRFRDSIRQLPGDKRPKPHNLETILDRLSTHPHGQEIAEIIASGRFAKSQNFGPVISAMGSGKKRLLQSSVDQIRFANDLHKRGFRDFVFDYKGGGGDVDIWVRDSPGGSVGYQLKRLNDPRNPVNEINRYLRQLKKAKEVDHKVMLVDARGTLAEWRSKGYVKLLQQVHEGTHPQVRTGKGFLFFIRLDDGVIAIPPGSSLYRGGQ
ncbi:hypothetical protein [Streptomyces sp. URMC 123]|uniref:hypothetical protein n=1 Tax=Streptomyces sp. URMC 123 TaxID=3423403 RepID=UPI003F1E0BAB